MKCKECGIESLRLGYDGLCFTCHKKAYKKAYRQSDKYKAYRQSDKYKAYRQSDKYKASQKAYQKAYYQNVTKPKKEANRR